MQLSRPRDEEQKLSLQKFYPPTTKLVSLVANAGKRDTVAGVLSTVMMSEPVYTPIAGSSTDTAEAYEQAHAAQAAASSKTEPKSRIGHAYEAQVARAVQESYYTWFSDKQKRERVCEALSEGTATTAVPMLTDTAVDYTYQ